MADDAFAKICNSVNDLSVVGKIVKHHKRLNTLVVFVGLVVRAVQI